MRRRDLAVVGDDPELEVPMAHRGGRWRWRSAPGSAPPTRSPHLPEERRPHLTVRGVEEELGVPVVIHTGLTGIGAGQPGGGGVRLKYSNPMCVDDVAIDFPELTIVMAHPSFPWQDGALAVATHQPRVYIDLSGWDYSLLTPDRWLADFAELPIKPEVRTKILKETRSGCSA